MSLSSYFTKKHVQRRTQTINQSAVSLETGEKRPITLGSKSIATAQATSQTKSSRIKKGTPDLGDVGFENQVSPPVENNKFTFGFNLDKDDNQTSRKAKKRRNRGKKKKKGKDPLLKDSDTCSKGETEDEIVKTKNKVVATSHVESSICEETATISSFGRSEKVNEPTPSNESLQNIIRTPPGFSRLPRHHQQQQQTLELTENNVRKGTKRTRKTPRKINMQTVGNRSLSQHENIPSQIDDQYIVKERKLRFNPAEKRHAMVNHHSLAVRNERMEEKVEKGGDNNAFSFGFTFDSLLKDYL